MPSFTRIDLNRFFARRLNVYHVCTDLGPNEATRRRTISSWRNWETDWAPPHCPTLVVERSSCAVLRVWRQSLFLLRLSRWTSGSRAESLQPQPPPPARPPRARAAPSSSSPYVCPRGTPVASACVSLTDNTVPSQMRHIARRDLPLSPYRAINLETRSPAGARDAANVHVPCPGR